MPSIHPKVLALSLDERLHLETVLAEFEESWDSKRLDLQVDRLPPAGHPLRRLLLIELVKIDLERRWQRGRAIGVADYLMKYPELGPAADLADLLLAEKEARAHYAAMVEARERARRRRR